MKIKSQIETYVECTHCKGMGKVGGASNTKICSKCGGKKLTLVEIRVITKAKEGE